MSSYLIRPDQEPRPVSPDSHSDSDSHVNQVIMAQVVEPSQPQLATGPSALERFLSNFLREENIKWMSIIVQRSYWLHR